MNRETTTHEWRCRPSFQPPMLDNDLMAKETAMESLSPMGRPSTVKDITDAVMYLTEAATVTGDVLYVDGGSHFGRW